MTVLDSGPLVSVIIPTYNREAFLSEAVDSVIGQTYGNWELIIVDDRSTDNTAALVRRYMDQDRRVTYVENTRTQGPAGARNRGQDLATGEYIAFLDSDDVWKSHHLEVMIDEFSRNGDIDLIYANSEIVADGKLVTASVFDKFWENRRELAVTRRGALAVLERKDLLANAIRHGLCAGCQCSVIRSRVFATNNFDEALFAAEDWLFFLGVIHEQYQVAYLENVHFTYRSHPDGISADPERKSTDHNLRVYREFEKCYTTIPRRMQLTGAQSALVKDRLAELHFWSFDCSRRSGQYITANAFLLKGIRLRPLKLLFWKAYLVNKIRLAASRLLKPC